MAPKRPRDPNQLAKSIIGIATGQIKERRPKKAQSKPKASKARKTSK
jgi:hypothetical protein